ncbi:MAG: coproporphyrinogen dehydrogenase HemZ [Lachnospiraceae bacterium]|nr:coproporphyrinogen dehydrogenase HemZ [Lachnospiraceae bacterium]
MITVLLDKAEFEYDIHSLVKAFYPKEDVYVSTKDKEKKEEPVHYHMDVQFAPEEIIFSWKKVETSEDNANQTGITKRVAVDYTNRKETKNSLKRTLYQLLSEYTGVELPWGNLTGIRPTKIPMALLEEGKSEEEIARYMKETYFASDEKIKLSIEIAERELELLHKLDYEEGYSLYIGIPFCPTTCLYCSFTSYSMSAWKNRMDDYLSALEKELDYTAVKFAHKKLNSIYIGGGTPTTLNPKQLDRLIRKIKCSFDLSDLVEFTVEAGRPDSITKEKLMVLRNHDISRISINPQTMKQETLDLIGRHHTVQQTIDSFYLARELGFDNINMDLIVGLPGESLSDVADTMEVIRKLAPDNLTVHSLAIKRAARLNIQRERYQDFEIVNTADHIALTSKVAEEMGLFPYYLYRQKNMAGNFENVGYAAPGKAGVYNVLIMEEKQSIVACGAGASTKRVWVQPNPDGTHRIERAENVKDVAQYIARIDEMIERKSRLFTKE